MLKSFQLKLIDGVFTGKEARELLLNLYSDKIHFHELKNFSSRERSGTDDARATIRIAELRSCKDLLEQVVIRTDVPCDYKIYATIHVEETQKSDG